MFHFAQYWPESVFLDAHTARSLYKSLLASRVSINFRTETYIRLEQFDCQQRHISCRSLLFLRILCHLEFRFFRRVQLIFSRKGRKSSFPTKKHSQPRAPTLSGERSLFRDIFIRLRKQIWPVYAIKSGAAKIDERIDNEMPIMQSNENVWPNTSEQTVIGIWNLNSCSPVHTMKSYHDLCLLSNPKGLQELLSTRYDYRKFSMPQLPLNVSRRHAEYCVMCSFNCQKLFAKSGKHT